MTQPRLRLWLLLGLLLVATFVSLSAGTLWLTPDTVLERLLAHNALDFEVWNHRLPRSLIAILAGCAFGLAGAIVQGVIRNPLASLEILGVTQGAVVALTSVRQPTGLIGRTAVELLVEQLEDPEIGPRQVVFKPELVVRASTGQ